MRESERGRGEKERGGRDRGSGADIGCVRDGGRRERGVD